MSKAWNTSQIPNITQSFIGFKNKIINGDFSVWQRGTSFSTSTANDIPYTADRWKIGYHPEDKEVKIEKAGIGLKFTNNQTSNISSIKQLIEPIMMYELLSNSGIYHYTLSYLMKNDDLEVDYSNLSGIAFRVEYTDGTSHQFPATVGLQRERQTWLIEIDANNIDHTKTIYAFSIELYFKPSTITYLYEVQLEGGTVATNFEHVPYDVQLQRCMRYYEKGYVGGTMHWDSGKEFAAILQFKVQKRTVPTMSYPTTYSNYNTTAFSVKALDANGGILHSNVSKDYILLETDFIADAEL